MNPKISIVIPVYNAEEFIVECLDSVLAQTLAEIQVLCVNDGSTDRSGEILKQYADKDSRVRIIDKKNGGGPGATRNAALPFIKGKFLLFVDSDDVVDAELCEKAVRRAEESGADIVVFSYDHFPVLDVSNPMDSIPLADVVCDRPGDELDTKIRCGLFTRFLTPWCKIYRTEFYLDNDIRYPESAFIEDNGMNWKPMVLAKKIVFLPEILYHYRVRYGSVVRPASRRLPDGCRSYEEARRAMIECGVYPKIRTYFLNEWLGLLRSYFRRISSSARVEAGRRVLETFGDDEWDFIRNSRDIKKKTRAFFLELEKGGGPGTTSWLIRAEFARLYVRFVRPLMNRWRLNLVGLFAPEILRGRESLRKQVAELSRERSALEAELRRQTVSGDERKAA